MTQQPVVLTDPADRSRAYLLVKTGRTLAHVIPIGSTHIRIETRPLKAVRIWSPLGEEKYPANKIARRILARVETYALPITTEARRCLTELAAS